MIRKPTIKSLKRNAECKHRLNNYSGLITRAVFLKIEFVKFKLAIGTYMTFMSKQEVIAEAHFQ